MWLLLFTWLVPAAISSTWANTTFLKTFGDALLHTFIRFCGSAIIGSITLFVTGEVRSLKEVCSVVARLALPATLLWIANYSNSLALSHCGVTLTYVVKSCIPVFTVIICTLQGKRFPVAIYASLIPICGGVALASASPRHAWAAVAARGVLFGGLQVSCHDAELGGRDLASRHGHGP